MYKWEVSPNTGENWKFNFVRFISPDLIHLFGWNGEKFALGWKEYWIDCCLQKLRVNNSSKGTALESRGYEASFKLELRMGTQLQSLRLPIDSSIVYFAMLHSKFSSISSKRRTTAGPHEYPLSPFLNLVISNTESSPGVNLILNRHFADLKGWVGRWYQLGA